jgi:hypothetical protein
MRRWFTATFVVAAALACAPLTWANAFSALTTTIIMDCSGPPAPCNWDPGSQGSPEHGIADFSPVAPGWSATFDSGPAIAWGVIFGAYQAEFGMGGSFAIAAPGGMQLSGMLTSGVAFSFPGGYEVTVAWFQGYWNSGLYADGVMTWENLDAGAPVTLDVTTYTPEPGSFLLFGSALAGLAGMLRRTLH